MEDTVLRAAKPKASLEQDPNLLTFGSTAIAAPKIQILRCCGRHRVQPLGPFEGGVDGCCRGSAATAKDRLRKATQAWLDRFRTDHPGRPPQKVFARIATDLRAATGDRNRLLWIERG